MHEHHSWCTFSFWSNHESRLVLILLYNIRYKEHYVVVMLVNVWLVYVSTLPHCITFKRRSKFFGNSGQSHLCSMQRLQSFSILWLDALTETALLTIDSDIRLTLTWSLLTITKQRHRPLTTESISHFRHSLSTWPFLKPLRTDFRLHHWKHSAVYQLSAWPLKTIDPSEWILIWLSPQSNYTICLGPRLLEVTATTLLSSIQILC